MVERSFIGVARSGFTQTSAVLSMSSRSSFGARPVKVKRSARPRAATLASISARCGPSPTMPKCTSERAIGPVRCAAAVDQEVEPLLLADHPHVADEVACAALQLRPRRTQPKRIELRSGADHEHVLGRLAAAGARDRGVAVVGGDRDVGGAEVQPLEQPHRPPERPAAAVLGLVELRADVVVVEDVAHPPGPQRPGDQEQRSGRVAAVQDVDPALAPHPVGEAQLVAERGAVFAQVVPNPADAVGAQRVAVDVHPVEHLVFGLAAAAGRADHRDRVAGADERGRLRPDPPVEGHRQVLHDDEHTPRHPLPHSTTS